LKGGKDVMKKSLLQISRFVPCSVALLTVAAKEKQDAMTASTMFVSENPPLLSVSVAKHIVSHDLIEKAGEFVLNLASKNQVKLAKQLGFTHGSKVDKFKRFSIRKEKGSKIGSPLIKGSFANIECKVITSLSAANYIVYLAEAVAWKIDDKLTPIAWYNNKYFALNEEVR
jgi:flavin reductase (DIM6/NTAB) family NADH-FMN oxidoreductase RutF